MSTSYNDTDFSNVMQNIKTIQSNINYKKNTINPVINIASDDVSELSTYDTELIKVLSDIHQTLAEKKPINYTYLTKVFEKIIKSKGDLQKEYLMHMFFPEKCRGATSIIPLSMPTYTYSQRYTCYCQPNKYGAFLVQVVTPVMIEDTQENELNSIMYLNTSDDLNGQVIDGNINNYQAMPIKVVPYAFSSFVLQSCKVTAKYVGNRELSSSGIFGAGFSINSVNKLDVDTQASLFENVNHSINPVLSHVLDGVSVIYYPTDYNHLNLQSLNDVANVDKLTLSQRLNIYGVSLPPGSPTNKSAGVAITLNIIWNVIPDTKFLELLPVDYSMLDQSVSLYDVAKFIPSSGLATFKVSETGMIERMLQLPSHIRHSAVKELSLKGNISATRTTVLDVLQPLIAPGITPYITIDTDVFAKMALRKRLDILKNAQDNKYYDLNNSITYNRTKI